jgi:hypothetical protein
VFDFVTFYDISIGEFHDPCERIFADNLGTHCAFVGFDFDVLHWVGLDVPGGTPATARGTRALPSSRIEESIVVEEEIVVAAHRDAQEAAGAGSGVDGFELPGFDQVDDVLLVAVEFRSDLEEVEQRAVCGESQGGRDAVGVHGGRGDGVHGWDGLLLGVGRWAFDFGNFELSTSNSQHRRAEAAGRGDDADGGVAGGDEAGGMYGGDVALALETEQRGRAKEAAALEPEPLGGGDGRVWEEWELFHWEQGM